eukprot:TRINITY_DN26_c0_g1_i2.p1 TRINITY_DN26_c0_g1~~TRINITY_DN26_c0_g1_i2.p1  ORF type:complete len:180 (-),score=49.61 TRINITY_DN26_c0_g1_i2:20-559(-)
MENLTHGYEEPSMMDIKMGKTTAGPDAKPEKLEAMKAKDTSTTSDAIGQRLTGYKAYQVNGPAKKLGKDVTKKLTVDNYKENVLGFFHNGETLRLDLVEYFLGELLKVQEYFHRQTLMSFYSSSLLFVYDGANPEPHGRLKIIDFAHVFDLEDGAHDDNYIFGIDNLVTYFQEFLSENQ